jgi:hypothetical protein
MFAETINEAHAIRTGATMTRDLLSLFVALLFTLTIHTTKAHAQVAGDLEVTIPFQFHAGDTKLPAGKYTVHTLDNTDLRIMEISSEDGTTSALFEVHDAEANPAPAKSELIFNKYGNRYFLTKLFDEGSANGSSVDESRYEKKVSQAATEAQAHVPAHHRGQQGS